MSRLWTNKPLALVFCAVMALGLACAHKQAVVAPEPSAASKAQAPPPPTGTTMVQPEPTISPAEHPESEVTATELPSSLQEINKAGYLKDALFDTDKSELRPDVRDVLAADAAWLKAQPAVKVLVEGHCDERNTEDYNLALGWRRANNAKAYLVMLGVPADQIVTISYGEERPFATCHNETCWSQNRRAHFVITAR